MGEVLKALTPMLWRPFTEGGSAAGEGAASPTRRLVGSRRRGMGALSYIDQETLGGGGKRRGLLGSADKLGG